MRVLLIHDYVGGEVKAQLLSRTWEVKYLLGNRFQLVLRQSDELQLLALP